MENVEIIKGEKKTINTINIIKKPIIIYILVYIFFIALGMTFYPAGDDFFFWRWQFASIKDFIMMNPINKYVLMGVPYNGRYLGNMFGVLLAKLYNTDFWYLRGIFMGSGIFLLYYLLVEFASNKSYKKIYTMMFILFFFVSIPTNMFMQVVSWGAAYCNYFLPMIGFLIILNFLKEDNYQVKATSGSAMSIWYPIAFVAAIATQLFMETVTVYCAFFSVILLVVVFKKDILPISKVATVCVGIWIGTIIMFTNRGYSNLNTSFYEREIGFSSFLDNANLICSEGIVYNCIMTLVISYLLIKACSIDKRDNKFTWIKRALVIINIYNIVVSVLYSFSFIDKRIWTDIIVGVITLIILTILTIFYMDNSSCKWNIIFWGLSIAFLYAMLLLLKPIGARNLFLSYIFGIFICMELLSYLKKKEIKINIRAFKYGTVALAMILLIAYFSNLYVLNAREDYVLEQMSKGETVVYIPRLPFRKYYNTDDVFINVQFFYNKYYDIEFYSCPYSKWKIIISEKNKL